MSEREMAMEAIKASLKKTTIRDSKLIDFDSSGYGPSAVGRIWNLVDELTRDNRFMRLHINGIRPLSADQMKRVQFYIPADKKLEGISDAEELAVDRSIEADAFQSK